MESNEEEIRRVHVKHDEKYRETKIRLDTDVQLLEQELEHIKALCLVNSEKLDYNYQVLKKREDENVIIKNNQKRTLNKYVVSFRYLCFPPVCLKIVNSKNL